MCLPQYRQGGVRLHLHTQGSVFYLSTGVEACLYLSIGVEACVCLNIDVKVCVDLSIGIDACVCFSKALRQTYVSG